MGCANHPPVLAREASLAVGFCMELIAGVVYSIGVWDAALASATGWPLDQMATLKSALNLGLYVSPDLGLLIDHFGKAGREWPAALLTTLLLGLGWLTLFLAASLRGAPLAAGVLAFLLIGHGNFAAFAAPLRANSENFGSHRKGLVDGLLVAGFGASAALFSQVYARCFGARRIAEFLLTFACFSVGTSLASMVATRRLPLANETSVAGLPITPDLSVRPCAALRASFFWRLWAALALSGGANIWFVQSAGRLAAQTPGASAATLVFWFAAGNLSGRCGGGLASDALQAGLAGRAPGFPARILLAVPSALLMAAAAATLLLLAEHAPLRSSALAVGLSEGLLFACWPGTVRDVFGEEGFSANLSLVNTALGAGSTLYLKAFGPQLASPLYAACGLCCLAAGLAASLYAWPLLQPQPQGGFAQIDGAGGGCSAIIGRADPCGGSEVAPSGASGSEPSSSTGS